MSKYKVESITDKYPRIAEIGITIHLNEYTSYIDPDEVDAALKKFKLDKQVFDKLFMGQTGPVVGNKGCLYPWDVEAILERMMSGNLTGSQKYWD